MIQKNVLWLEVSVDDISFVKVFQGKKDFCSIELRNILCELFTPPE